MNLEQLETALESAQKTLADLQAEQKTLPKRVAKAAGAGDDKQLLALRQRVDQLPAALFAAACVALRAEMALLDAQFEQAKAPLAEAAQVVTAAAEKVEAAQQELLDAQTAVGRLQARRQGNRERFHGLRRKLEDLTAQQTGRTAVAPVVRSLPHSRAVAG